MDEGVLISTKEPSDNFQKLFSKRLNICKSCPLYMKEREVCNPNLWVNPITKESSKSAKRGYVKGCGCLIPRKAAQPTSHCNAGLW